MNVKTQMYHWLNKLERAIKDRNPAAIINAYEENEKMELWEWDNVEEAMRDRYDELVARANNIIYS